MLQHIDPVEACRDNVIIAARFLVERDYDLVSRAVMEAEVAKLDLALQERKRSFTMKGN